MRRLKPGMTLKATEAQLAIITPEIMRNTVPKWDSAGQKEYLSRKLILEPASTGFSGLGRMYGQALITLQVVVAIVLLIACANVANLLLARSTARQRELSVRLAIGAGRARIVRQLLTESLLLAAGGAMAGLFLASWGTKLLVHMLNSSDAGNSGKPFDYDLDTSLDLTVVGFVAAIVVLTTLFFGLLPALRASSTAPNTVLKEQARGSVAGGGRLLTLSNVMVAVQVGLALTLLSAAALFGESFRRILSVDSGFDTRNIVLVSVEVPQALLSKLQRTPVFDEALERLRRVPGIRSASRGDWTPISHVTWNDNVYPDGYKVKSTPDELLVYFNNVSPHYFETIGSKLVAGRDFDARDLAWRTSRHHYWGDDSPLILGR